MLENFFKFETEYPVGSGFELFHSCHVLWLFGLAVFMYIACKKYKKMDRLKQKKWYRRIGMLLPIMELYRDVVLIVTKHWNNGFMPLHLCSMALIIAFLYSYTNYRFFGVVYVLLCMPGALAAVLFPDWTGYPFFNYMHIHAFITHGLTILFGFLLLISKSIVIKKKDFLLSVFFALFGFILISKLNVIWNTNFWFLNEAPIGSPLEIFWSYKRAKYYHLFYFLFGMCIVGTWQIAIMKWNKGFNEIHKS